MSPMYHKRISLWKVEKINLQGKKKQQPNEHPNNKFLSSQPQRGTECFLRQTAEKRLAIYAEALRTDGVTV